MDYSKLSDADLKAIYNKDLSSVSDDGLKELYSQMNPPEEKPTAGPVKTFFKRAGLGALPAIGGVGLAEAVGAVVAPEFAIPAMLVSGIAGGYGAGKAQQAALEAAPETAKKLGVDPETLAAEEQKNPISAKFGELAPNLAIARPTVSGTKALFGIGEKEAVAAARTEAAKMAGINTVGDVIQQKLSDPTGNLDWKSLGESALLGGLSTHTTGIGRGIGNLGRRAVGAEPILPPEARMFHTEDTTTQTETTEPTAEELAAQQQTEQAERQKQFDAEKSFREMTFSALKTNPTVKQFREITGLDAKTAKAEMDKLVQDGYLLKDEKTGKYSIMPEFSQFEFVSDEGPPSAKLNEVPPKEEPAPEVRPSSDVDESQLGFNFERPPPTDITEQMGLPFPSTEGVTTGKTGQLGLGLEGGRAEGEIFDDETYRKALDAVVANGKATAPLIMKATGATRTKALEFMQDLDAKGITRNNKIVGIEGEPTRGIPAGLGTEGRGKSAKVPVSKRKPGVEEATGTVATGLGGAGESIEPTASGETPSSTPLDYKSILQQAADKTPEQLRKEAGKSQISSLGSEDRLRIIRNLFKPQETITPPPTEVTAAKPTEVSAKVPLETKKTDYKSRAMDAYERDDVDDKTYEKITGELSKPNPNFDRVDDWITGADKQRIATTTEKIETATAARKKAAKSDKELEAEADRLLNEANPEIATASRDQLDALGRIRYQRTPKWYYSKLSRTVAELPEKAFGTAEALLNKIRNTEGIKKDELEAVGLPTFLQTLGRNATKKEVQKFLKSGGFQLKETVLKDFRQNNKQFIKAQKAYKQTREEYLAYRKKEEQLKEKIPFGELNNLESDTHISNRLINTLENRVFQNYNFGWDLTEDFNRINPTEITHQIVIPNRAFNKPLYEQGLENIIAKILNSPEIKEWYEWLPNVTKKATAFGRANTKLSRIMRIVDENKNYGDYIQPGENSNYRVFLLQNPNSEFKFTHFEEPGVIAHIRTTDRVGKDGKKVLLVEEIQSDWSQRLRDQETVKKLGPELHKLDIPEKQYDDLYVRFRDHATKETPLEGLSPEGLTVGKKIWQYEKAKRFLNATEHLTTGPFVEDGHAINRLALKKVLSHAAAGGYDRVEFVRGEESKRSVGGELKGQKYYYDEQLPSDLRKLAFQEKLGTVEPPTKEDYGISNKDSDENFIIENRNDPRLNENNQLHTEDGYRLGINLTPEVRQKINEAGFSLFHRGTGEKNLVAHEDVVKAANEATRGWKNAPKIEVVPNREALPEHLQGVPEDARGFYDPATKTTYVISENAPSLEGVKATVFHESLGHYGLADKFRTNLDSVLNKMYADNPAMRQAADEWLKNNSDTYAHLDEATQKSRAVEEVFAERSESGPITEGGFKGAFNKVVAFVKDWMRQHGFNVKYSDNDITQILRQAHEGVMEKPVAKLVSGAFDPQIRYQMSPGQQRANDSELLHSYGSLNNNKPSPTKEMYRRGRDALSELPSSIRRAVLATLNVNHIANEFEHAVPALRTRHDILNTKGAAIRKGEEIITKNVKDSNAVLRKYSVGERQRFFDIFHSTTLDQIEVLDDANRGWTADKTNSLYRQFKALPPEVQDVYKTMRETYDNQSKVMLGVLHDIMLPNEYQRFIQQWKLKRLNVYLPLFRTGEHWLSYTDKNGEVVKRSFETMGERTRAMEEAKRIGAKDVTPYHNLQQMVSSMKGAPPTRFLGDVLRSLNKAKVDDSVKEQIIDSFLNMLPAKSVMQMARKREGTAGYEPDALKTYANVASMNSRHIENVRYATKLNDVMDNIRQQVQESMMRYHEDPADKTGLRDDVAHDLMANVESSHQDMLNPKYNWAMSRLQYANYVNYLGGNLSTAYVALTHLPTVVYPTLGKISGLKNAWTAMWDANKTAMALNFHGGKGVDPLVRKVIEQGHADGVLGERRAEDIAEFKTYGTDRYLGIKAKADAVLNKSLGTVDKHNREVALLASYDLNRAKLMKEGKLTGEDLHNEAYKRAKQDVYDTIGSAFSSARANVFQQPLAQLFLTFKQFAMQRMYLLAKSTQQILAKETSPAVRKAAITQMVGFFAMAGIMAGVKGMPFVGWGEEFAQLLNDMTGGDESFNASEAVKQGVGLLAYKGPINYYMNLATSDRTGWDSMIWRDDPKRRSDIGFMDFAAEKFLGPTYTYAVRDVPAAYKDFEEGNLERGVEKVVPHFASNVMRGVRYATEGATTRDGVPIKQDINAYNALMQVAGFAPADLQEKQEETSGRIGLQKTLEDKRKALLRRMVMAKVNGDDEGFQAAVQDAVEFSQRHPGARINGANVHQSFMQHNKRMHQSVDGVFYNKKLRPELMSVYPEEEEE